MITQNWLQWVHQSLVAEGFHDPGPLLQIVKPEQVFGLIKKLDDVWEMHVRGFENGTLEAEIEVSREYLEHLNPKYTRDATSELQRILDAYGVPYRTTGTTPGATIALEAPQTLTPWKPLLVILGLLWIFGREKRPTGHGR